MTTIGGNLPQASVPKPTPLPMESTTHPLFRILAVAAGGLSAQRARMEVAAQNIANSETTRTAEGGPYRRKTVALEVASGTTEPTDAGGVRVAGIGEDASEGPLVYDPGHPDANEKGYVRMPNVRITDEMMDMMDARRVYDANATVFQSAKAMLRSALDL
jgi:flagellar basal-body rod protein FlgC